MQQSAHDLVPRQQGEPSPHLLTVVIGAMLLLAIVVGALLVPLPFHGRTASVIGDFVHAPLFGTMTLLTLFAWGRVKPLGNRCGLVNPICRLLIARGLIVGSVWCALGLGIELLQEMTGRSATQHDAIANALGIVSAVCIYASKVFATCGRSRQVVLFVALAVAGFATAWWRPARLLADVIAVSTQFPLLASFESSEEQTRWYLRGARAKRVPLDSTHGAYSFEVRFGDHDGPAMTLVEVYPDWTSYDFLELDVCLLRSETGGEETQVDLIIKIMDRQNRRDRVFRTNELVSPGPIQRLRIPLSEFRPRTTGDAVDLTKMVYVEIGLWKVGRPVVIRFDRLILTRSG